ncbi:MAG: hypothetical protein E7655_09280 [Ruminococcaceae bacterium]|nr:hypothetical protein [Oscillospiraceae bacterium]
MKKTLLQKISLVLVFTLLLSTFSAVCMPYTVLEADAADSTIQKYEDTLKQLEKDKKALESKVSQLKRESSTVVQQKNLIDEEISLLNSKIEIANSLLAEYDERIRTSEADMEAMQKAIDEKASELEDHMVYYYKNRNLNYLSLLFSSESISDFIINLQRISSILNFDQGEIEKMNNAKKEMQDIKTKLNDSKARQGEIMAELEQLEKEAEAKGEEAIALINSLSRQTTQYQSEINTIIKETQEVDKQLEEYLVQLQKQSNADYAGGSMLWPVKTSNNRITSKYGWRNLWGTKDFHLGIDIAAPNGDPIYAANSGTVVSPPTHWTYGKCVLIDHGGGIATLYAHCSTLLVKVGDKVTRGQQIAKIGLTGQTSGYHLHFEVRVNGKTTDPLGGYVVKP